MAEIDLAFIARQLERLVNDVAGLKDDMTVVMARLDRLDATTHSLVTEVCAMHGRHDRVAKRIERWRTRTATRLPDGPEVRRGTWDHIEQPTRRARLRVQPKSAQDEQRRSTRPPSAAGHAVRDLEPCVRLSRHRRRFPWTADRGIMPH